MIRDLFDAKYSRRSRRGTGLRRGLGAVMAVALLWSCNESSDVATGRTGGTGAAAVDEGTVATGSITGFGSVIVQGTRFEVASGTVIHVDDNASAVEGDLRVGMVVRADGVGAGGSLVAREISYRANVLGPVETACAINAPMTVLGQPVVVDVRTLFDSGFVCDASAIGKLVEVSGQSESSGRIRATYVGLRAAAFTAGTTLRVRGKASVVDNAARRFRINGLTVSFAAAQQVGFPANGQLVDGAMVAVTASALPVQGVLNAARVSVESYPVVPAGTKAEVEGFVTRYVSATDFSVAGKRVTTNAQTVYEGGTAAQIGLDRKLHVDGTYTTDNVIVASKIEFEEDVLSQIEGSVTQVNLAAKTISVLGAGAVTVQIDSGCSFKDETEGAAQRFDLSKLQVGNKVVLAVRRSASGLLAVKLERTGLADSSGSAKLRGTVEAVARPQFTVLGVQVEASAAAQIRDTQGKSITRDALLNLLHAGATPIEVRGVFDGTRLLASEVRMLDKAD